MDAGIEEIHSALGEETEGSDVAPIGGRMKQISQTCRKKWATRACSLGLLCVFGSHPATAQKSAEAAVPSCRWRQLDLYNEGGEGATGHDIFIFALRNVSARRCALSGIPQLVFFDKDGRRLALPYGKNVIDFMFEKQPEQPVDLKPGDFAYFIIGRAIGDQHLHFAAMRVLLPGDDTALALSGMGPAELQAIDVSSIVAGTYGAETPNNLFNWVAPTKRIALASGALQGLALTLDVPPQPASGFDAHFVLSNSISKPIDVEWKNCTLREKLTDSAGTEVTASQKCGTWDGPANAERRLRKGDRVTADLTIGGDEFAQKICHTGQWNAELTLETPVGVVRYPVIPFQVGSTLCSER